MIDLAKDSTEYYGKQFNNLQNPSESFDGIEFDSCKFTECDFSDANFTRCKFIDCHFLKCNLSVLKVEYSKFFDVIFEDCKMVGVNWTKADWPSLALCAPIKLQKCIINDSSFYGLKLKELVIEECKAHDVDFREGDFTEANFSYSKFSGSLFNSTNLTGADFTEATDYHIDIYNNRINQAKFSRYEAVSLLESLDVELVD